MSARSRVMRAAEASERQRARGGLAVGLERRSAPALSTPSPRSSRRSGSARPGLEPEPCSRGPRKQARVTRSERRSARRARILVPVSNASRSCTLQCGERVDPAKMANSRMTLIARGPSFTSPNAKSRKDGGIRLRRRARTWSRWWQPPSGCRRSGTRLTRPKRDARRQTACARSYGHRGRR